MGVWVQPAVCTLSFYSLFPAEPNSGALQEGSTTARGRIRVLSNRGALPRHQYFCGCTAVCRSPPHPTGSRQHNHSPSQSRIRLLIPLYNTPSTEQTPWGLKKPTPISHGEVPFLCLPLSPVCLCLAPVLGSNIAAAMGAKPEQGATGEGFFSPHPPPVQTLLAVADSRCSERELGSPAGATWGRGQGKGTRAGTRSTQSLQDLAHSPARCWHIPQLSPGHLFQKNTFRTSSSLRIQHCEQLLARQKGKKITHTHCKEKNPKPCERSLCERGNWVMNNRRAVGAQ